MKFFKVFVIVLAMSPLLFLFQNCGDGFAPTTELLSSDPNSLVSQFEAKRTIEENRKALEELRALEAQGISQKTFNNSGIFPFAEYSKIGYLVASAHNQDGTWGDSEKAPWSAQALKARQKMAANLPSDVNLILYTHLNTQEEINRIKNQYKRYINLKRLAILYLAPTHENTDTYPKFQQWHSFWSRDVLPPVLVKNGNESIFVDAKYYKYYNPDFYIKNAFNGRLRKHSFFIAGGNFLATHNGHCFMVNNYRTSDIPDSIFKNYYGCRKLTRLKHIFGIGHVDEVIKPVSAKKFITNQKSYATILRKLGYQAILVPSNTGVSGGTYVNSVTINGTVFMPSYGSANDDIAASKYIQAGYERVVKINSKILSREGNGSLHCITMLYPKLPLSELKQALNFQNVKILKAFNE